MSTMMPSHFIWYRETGQTLQKLIFNIMTHDTPLLKSADWVLCTSTFDLEEGAYTHLPPHIVPIGPLLAAESRQESSSADISWNRTLNAWNGSTCNRPARLFYVAFGSTVMHSNAQFQLYSASRWGLSPDLIRPRRR
ncbi:hypothetical protein ACS0TY_001272 [Phlomoides rotata]